MMKDYNKKPPEPVVSLGEAPLLIVPAAVGGVQVVEIETLRFLSAGGCFVLDDCMKPEQEW